MFSFDFLVFFTSNFLYSSIISSISSFVIPAFPVINFLRSSSRTNPLPSVSRLLKIEALIHWPQNTNSAFTWTCWAARPRQGRPSSRWRPAWGTRWRRRRSRWCPRRRWPPAPWPGHVTCHVSRVTCNHSPGHKWGATLGTWRSPETPSDWECHLCLGQKAGKRDSFIHGSRITKKTPNYNGFLVAVFASFTYLK